MIKQARYLTAEFNRKIEIRKYAFGQNGDGAPIKVLTEFFDRWAMMDPLNGSRYLDNLGLTYQKAFKIITRYEVSNPLSSTDEIIYGGLTYVIASLTQLEEGRRNFNIIIAYTTGQVATEEEEVATTCEWEEIEW